MSKYTTLTLKQDLKDEMDKAIKETGFDLSYQQFITFLLRKSDVSITIGNDMKKRLDEMNIDLGLGMDYKGLVDYLLIIRDNVNRKEEKMMKVYPMSPDVPMFTEDEIKKFRESFKRG